LKNKRRESTCRLLVGWGGMEWLVPLAEGLRKLKAKTRGSRKKVIKDEETKNKKVVVNSMAAEKIPRGQGNLLRRTQLAHTENDGNPSGVRGHFLGKVKGN